jgi:hypothetical protein
VPTDRYVLEDRVVEGAAWSAWRATDSVLNRDVGVLVVAADHPRRTEVAAAARAAACVTDAGLLHVYDVVDLADGGLQVVREWTAGASLVDRLSEGPLDAEEACVLGIQVARALAAARASGVTHDALGPGDVLLSEDGRAKVAGLATRSALDPEGAEGDGGRTSDAWAAAAVTYAAVTGRWPGGDRDGLPGAGRPTAVPRPRQVRAGVPKALDQALVDSLAEPPDDPVGVAQTLEDVLAVVGRRAADREDADRPPKDRRPATIRLGVLLAVIAMAAAVWVGFRLAQGSTGEAGEPAASTPSSSSPSASPTATTGATGLVPILSGTDFDPDGNGHENPDQVPLAFDEDLATAWRTVSYDQSNLAPKSGVGVLFDLGQVETVGAVRLNLVGAGTTLQVRVSALPGKTPADFTAFGSGTNVGDLFTLRSQQPVQARYVLVWLTGLPADGTTYRGGITEIVVARS